MTNLKPLSWGPSAARPRWTDPVRRLAAVGLRSASAALASLAGRLTPPVAPPELPRPVLEFHAQAGASEGALYMDGQLVGWVAGVQRL